MAPGAKGPGGQGQGPPPPQLQTARGFKRLNCSDSRLSIDDDDLAWLENGMLVGRGVQTVPLYNGPAGVSLHPVGTDLKLGHPELVIGIDIRHLAGLFHRRHNALAELSERIPLGATDRKFDRETALGGKSRL